MKNILTIGLVALTFFSCQKNESGIEVFGLTAIDKDSIYNDLLPNEQFSFYELRNSYCWDRESYQVMHTFGSTNISPIQISNSGVEVYSGQLCYVINIVAQLGNEIQYYQTYDDILSFLGNVDSNGEALLIATLNGYYFMYNDASNGIKQSNGKFYLIAFKLVCDCLPLQTNRFLLEIDETGTLKIIDEEIFKKIDGACA